MRPDRLTDHLLRQDPARPRVTYYDDTDGPTRGERIELSAKVLTNWVNKAANLLQEEFDAGPGTVVHLALPAAHWRTVYWALAIWAVGATVSTTDPDDADVRIGTSDAGTDLDVLVTLAALARSHPEPTGTALDEARELATYADAFSAWASADGSATALRSATGQWAYDDLVEAGTGDREWVEGDLPATVRRIAGLFAGDGAVLLVRSPDPALMPARLAAEGLSQT